MAAPDLGPEPEELVSAANARMHDSAANIFRMAAQIKRARPQTTVSSAVQLAKEEWIRLLTDPELAAISARPAHEQTAGRLALHPAGDRP